MWVKKCVKIHEILFKNWKLLFRNTHQTPPQITQKLRDQIVQTWELLRKKKSSITHETHLPSPSPSKPLGIAPWDLSTPFLLGFLLLSFFCFFSIWVAPQATCVCVCVCFFFLILLTVYVFDRNELAEDLWVDDGGWVDWWWWLGEFTVGVYNKQTDVGVL